MPNVNQWESARELIEHQRRTKLQAMNEETSIRAFCSLVALAYNQRSQDEGWSRLMKTRWENKLAMKMRLLQKMQNTQSDRHQ